MKNLNKKIHCFFDKLHMVLGLIRSSVSTKPSQKNTACAHHAGERPTPLARRYIINSCPHVPGPDANRVPRFCPNAKTPHNMVSRLCNLLALCIWPGLALTSPSPHAETAAGIITALNLTVNPEKGYYTQTFSDSLNVTYTAITANGTGYPTTRAASTAIYYLLEGNEGDSYWHRHDGLEVWHYYAGAPLRLRLSHDDGKPVREVVLGGHVVGGGEGVQQRPQGFVGRWEWQSARSLGDWTLVGTTGKCIMIFWL